MADQIVWINPGIFPISIGFCPSEKAWKRFVKTMGLPHEPYPDTDARCTIFERAGHTTRCIVTVAERFDKRREVPTMALLVHESVHVWQQARMEMREDSPSREFEAYAVQYISQEMMDAYQATRKPKRKTTRRKAA